MEESDLTTVRARARVGSLLSGRWHLDALVGVGGMAAVYAATHRNGKRVAIKILHPEISVDDNARQRFLREGYAANRVGHAGAVAADDDGTTEDGTAFLVMELLEGETLDQRSARKGGTLPALELLALMDQALSTLVAAHDKGIVHRDLKPENLFFTSHGVLKLLDFGIARVQDRLGKSPSQTQGIMGTPSFMAPEQARGRWEDVDARTDLWAIGATMFTLLSGRSVHEAETANETLVLAVTQRAPTLAQVAADIHPAIAALVDKALSYEREARFQTASEFRQALRASHAAIAGDESSSPLSAPEGPTSASLRSGARRLTTVSGVAASVRSSDSTGIVSTKRASKLRFALVVLAAVPLLALALAGRALFGAHTIQRPLALSPETRAANRLSAESPPAPESLPASSAPTAEDDKMPINRDIAVKPLTAAAAVSAAPTSVRVASTSVRVASTSVRVAPNALLSAPRVVAVSGASTGAPAVPSKARSPKTTADLFKKRH